MIFAYFMYVAVPDIYYIFAAESHPRCSEMQDHSSFNASYDMGPNLENRFCRLAAHCEPILLLLLTVGSKQNSEAKNISSIFDKTFLNERFSITSEYEFCSALNALSYEILFNFFARNATEKIIGQQKKICRLAIHCAPQTMIDIVGCPSQTVTDIDKEL
jgi:hypothetical protein